MVSSTPGWDSHSWSQSLGRSFAGSIDTWQPVTSLSQRFLGQLKSSGEAVFSDIIGEFALALRSRTHKPLRNKRGENRHSAAIDVTCGFLTVRMATSSLTRLCVCQYL